MAHIRVPLILATVVASLLATTSASAQVFGTFAWQMQPYCNVVTLTITQFPAGYTVDGNDNQCGAATLAAATGQVHINPDGTVGVNFAIITTPSGKAVHVAALLSPANGSGTWTDSVGNSGTFALGVNTGTGSPRPLPSSGVAAASITNVEIANNAITSANVANGSLTTADLLDGPRAAFAGGDQSVTLGAPAIVRSVSVTAPTAGQVIVNASGYFSFAFGTVDSARCWLSPTAATTIVFSHLIIAEEDSADAMGFVPWAHTRGFVAAAGTFTVNLVCDLALGAADVRDTNLTAVFVAQ